MRDEAVSQSNHERFCIFSFSHGFNVVEASAAL
jgi:hypothetical protein